MLWNGHIGCARSLWSIMSDDATVAARNKAHALQLGGSEDVMTQLDMRFVHRELYRTLASTVARMVDSGIHRVKEVGGCLMIACECVGARMRMHA